MSISMIGYLGFEVSDVAAWQKYATEFVGLMEVQADQNGAKYRIDQRDWRIAVSQGPADDIAYLGLEVRTTNCLNKIAQQLENHKVEFVNDSELAQQRDVRELLVCKDPAGLQVEIYVGATERFEQPFLSPAAVSGFVTGNQGVGHVVLGSADMDAVRSFYSDVLGFKISDTIGMKFSEDFTLLLEFYHCNPRHHSLALAPVPTPKRLLHFMLEAKSLDDVGFALDRVEAQGVELTMSLGKHTNDQMVSFYTKTPSGFELEFGHGGVAVDDDNWHVAHHQAISSWGHKRSE